jgi:DNA polymerase III delta subunit
MSVMVLYGNAKEMIQMKVSEITQEYRANGYEIREASGKDVDLEGAFSSGLFDTDPILVCVYQPTKIKGLKDYLKDTRGCEVLVIHENDRLPKLLEGFPTLEMIEPKYDNEKKGWCAKFVQDLASRYGKKIDPKLSLAIVNRVGLDVGVLRWEVVKYVMACGEEEVITPQIVAGLLTDLADPNSMDLINSIAERNDKAFLKMCARIESSSSTDQTMAVCNGLLLYYLIQWLEVGALLEAKLTPEQVAQDLGKNPYYVSRHLIPAYRSLGMERIQRLIGALYECESAVLLGARDGWVKFKASVLMVL